MGYSANIHAHKSGYIGTPENYDAFILLYLYIRLHKSSIKSINVRFLPASIFGQAGMDEYVRAKPRV